MQLYLHQLVTLNILTVHYQGQKISESEKKKEKTPYFIHVQMKFKLCTIIYPLEKMITL